MATYISMFQVRKIEIIFRQRNRGPLCYTSVKARY